MLAVYLLAWLGAVGWIAAVGWAGWRWIAKRWKPGAWAWTALAVSTPVWFFGVWAFLWEPETLVVRRIAIVSQAWTAPPLRIGVIADIHMGAPHMSVGRVRRLVKRMNSEQVDVDVLLGDYVGRDAPARSRSTGERAAIAASLDALGGLTAPFGTYAVLGNHDWWYDGPLVAEELGAAGIHVLENQSLRVQRPDSDFWIAGLMDFAGPHSPSYTRSLADVPDGASVIALSHRPDKFAAAPGRVALTLAGHTHCGQVRIPYLGRYMPGSSTESKRWSCGLYEDHGRRLYVSGGVGVSFLPVRFLQPPEIAVVTIYPDPGQIRAPAQPAETEPLPAP
ncbi:MAG: metallophosphoesterase [Alphaproteobacteria bacterium]|nr:metallophosphoesterase [Alphaproteobacteria bacterium]